MSANIIMKKPNLIPIYSLLLLALAFSVYNFIQQKKSKIACIDLVKVLSNNNDMKEINKEFSIKEKALEQKGDTVISEFQNEIKAFEKNIANMTETDKKEFTKRMNTKQSQFMNYKEVNQKKITEQKLQLTQKILDKVNKLAKNYAIKHGYKILLGATGNGSVIYLADTHDITSDIIKELNND
jgi:outer membrane protein